MPKQTKLEISRYEQISSARSLENAYHKATQSSCEIEDDTFVLESGEIYTASPELVGWYYKSVYNSLATDVTVIINHEQKHASIIEKTDDAIIIQNIDYVDEAHERKWRRFKVTVYRQKREVESSHFGEEYHIDEIKSEADDRLSKYVGEHQPTTWKQNEHTHRKTIGDYSVEIDVIP